MSGSMVDTRSNKKPGKKWPISRFIPPELFPSFLSEVSNAKSLAQLMSDGSEHTIAIGGNLVKLQASPGQESLFEVN